jgi:hypothetical protein
MKRIKLAAVALGIAGITVGVCPLSPNYVVAAELSENDTALITSISIDDLRGVQEALEKGTNVRLALASQSDDWVENLENGILRAQVMLRSPKAEADGVTIVELMINQGAKLSPLSLYLPITLGHRSMTEVLLKHGASISTKLDGYSPAELAIKNQQPEIYSSLLANGATPVPPETEAQIKLMHAAYYHDEKGIKAALAAGASINDADPSGRTALVSALYCGGSDAPPLEVAVSLLLQSHANPNMPGNAKPTSSSSTEMFEPPLHAFVYGCGALLTKQDGGWSISVRQTLDRLLASGAKISGRDQEGKTPLHIAAEFDSEMPGMLVPVATVLIEHGAKVKARDAYNKSPLDYAESEPMIRLLKMSGAVE